MEVNLGGHILGPDDPIYVVAEVGINHQGDIGLVEEFFRMASMYEFDCVKFQKRNPELWPETPYFSKTFNKEMTYREHKRKLEFEFNEYHTIDEFSKKYEVPWTVSVWDTDSVEFIRSNGFPIPFIKIPSACLTDDALLEAARTLDVPVVLGTGMSTEDQIIHAVHVLGGHDLIILHCTSTYPAANDELNLEYIPRLADLYPDNIIGYSGHESGLQASYYAGVMAYRVCGATMIERHITYERNAPGSDHAASLGHEGQRRLVRDLKLIPTILGDGRKVVYESELPIIQKLRRI